MFQVDAAVQCESVLLKHKSVMVQPRTANKGTNFRVRKVKDMKIKPSKISHLPDSEESPCPSASLFGSSNFESTTSSSGIKNEQKVGRNHLMEIIKSKPKMYKKLLVGYRFYSKRIFVPGTSYNYDAI